ncbi:hypothetical protein SAMN05518669_108182 [Variovorax sp. YR634]|uniref:hypothetical protein n=1 Tax=Variovorax sp. YR634 TaxID=1884385 RepID=UPI00089496DE|nr:hypothetical protein [Variovorax sp. YR634]SDY01899.1 hypothetical protein SAMN05518669_108182 [Variovorax sp. YR634]
MSSIRNTATTQPSALVAQALAIYRSIAACHAHIANNSSSSASNANALTAALMLPCYQSSFRELALALTLEEERELRYALDEFRNSAA